MRDNTRHLNPADAARRLGVSAKALRLYEQRGLIAPPRTEAGWRCYGPTEMARAREIVALRRLGLSLAQIERVLRGDPANLEPILAAHQTMLENQARGITDAVLKIRVLRADLARGKLPNVADLAALTRPATPLIAFDLPWPWGGERFEILERHALTYIVGPLGSGKTRLAQAIADAATDAAFIGLDRLADNGAAAQAAMVADQTLQTRVEQKLAWLIDDGAAVSGALVALLVAMESSNATTLVIDMIEQGLDRSSQEALSSCLRRRIETRPMFMLTRSSSILDLDAVSPDEAIILCPANHSPPTFVTPYPGSPGYEAVATCLATPDVRARTAGVVAVRSAVA